MKPLQELPSEKLKPLAAWWPVPHLFSKMPIVSDVWGDEVDINRSYIAYRNRLIDVHLIHTFQTKGKRLLINTYKQNVCAPTMCIFFDSKERAQEVLQIMKKTYYGGAPIVSQESDLRLDVGLAILVSTMVIPVILAIVTAYK